MNLTVRQHFGVQNTSVFDSENIIIGSVFDAVFAIRPSKPLYILFPERIRCAAAEFIAAFPGTAMYAAKTNSDPTVIQSLWEGGVRSFDVASMEEIRHIHALFPESRLYFMHPVKAAEAIEESYFKFGVRHFVLDSEEELEKILYATQDAKDLVLFVRVALKKNDAAWIDFSRKFGSDFEEAAHLLRRCKQAAAQTGLSFHIGTQSVNAEAYRCAVVYCAKLLRFSGVEIDFLNVGGGFPVPYADCEEVCRVEDCCQVISEALRREGLDSIPLLAEPGRVLVARGSSLITRVELRKQDLLYINDGIYGGLFDASPWLGLHYPVRAHRVGGTFSDEPGLFRFAGPTCDPIDMIHTQHSLPADIRTGDWVEFQHTGAYSQSLRSNFNGFGYADTVSLIETAEPYIYSQKTDSVLEG